MGAGGLDHSPVREGQHRGYDGSFFGEKTVGGDFRFLEKTNILKLTHRSAETQLFLKNMARPGWAELGGGNERRL